MAHEPTENEEIDPLAAQRGLSDRGIFSQFAQFLRCGIDPEELRFRYNIPNLTSAPIIDADRGCLDVIRFIHVVRGFPSWQALHGMRGCIGMVAQHDGAALQAKGA